MNQAPPILISSGSFKSLGNEYRIYEDHLELQSKLFFHTFIIPLDELIVIDVYRPPVIRTALWVLKLDLSDFCLHVGIERENGFFKKLRFAPEDPEEFVVTVKELAPGLQP